MGFMSWLELTRAPASLDVTDGVTDIVTDGCTIGVLHVSIKSNPTETP